jgi:hypothetical protein
VRDETRGGGECLPRLPTFVKNQNKRAPFLSQPGTSVMDNTVVIPRLLNSKPITLLLLPSKGKRFTHKSQHKLRKFSLVQKIMIIFHRPRSLSILHRNIHPNTMPIYPSIIHPCLKASYAKNNATQRPLMPRLPCSAKMRSFIPISIPHLFIYTHPLFIIHRAFSHPAFHHII